MCADQEVGNYPGARPAPAPVLAPTRSGVDGCDHVHRGEFDAESLQRLACSLAARKCRGHLRPDNLACDESPLVAGVAESILRAHTEVRIRSEDVEQDVRIDGGDQAPTSPRARATKASVPSSSLSTP